MKGIFNKKLPFFPQTLIRNERQPSCRKRPGPWWSHRPHHTQEGPTQVQTEADSYIQEQGSQTRPEGVKTNLFCFYTFFNQPLKLSLFTTSAALVTTFLAWRVSAQTSPWCAHGRPSVTWSWATWPNMASFNPPDLFPLILSVLPSVCQLGSLR